VLAGHSAYQVTAGSVLEFDDLVRQKRVLFELTAPNAKPLRKHGRVGCARY
jgi:hypothetical protein